MGEYTVFISYLLVPTSGYSQAIHCNYINALELITDTPYLNEIKLNFPNIGEFKFLSNNPSGGTGYIANEIYALIQVVSGTTNVNPVSTDWRMYKITDQIDDYYSGGTYLLTPARITSKVFEIPLLFYTGYTTYNLDYLNYPVATDINALAFGDEMYFFGNVTTDIKADVYVTDLPIGLPLNEFNSSTNATWDGVSSVAISEVGIYDANKNLVAIGKLNDPITKDSTISRTIVFAIDF
jgi:hypothetical protein